MSCVPLELDETSEVCSAEPGRTSPTGQVDPVAATIAQIQGRQHRSNFVDRTVRVTGVVTVAYDAGFYLQSLAPDADPATSEAVFVVTSGAPPVVPGNEVTVVGRVAETRPGCDDCDPGDAAFDYLTVTEIAFPDSIAVGSSSVPLPEPVRLGIQGRRPPATRIDHDVGGDVEAANHRDFDACGDALDFYESLEHMLVRIDDARAVGPTSPTGEIVVIGDAGRAAGELTPRGGILLRPGDSNPERVFVDDTLVPNAPKVHVGARFVEPIEGVMGYTRGNFKLFNSAPLIVERGNDLSRETLEFGEPAPNELDLATFNVENLSARDPAERFAGLADIVVRSLRSPDVLVLQEIQDDSGPADDGVVTAAATLSSLARAIEALGGPFYEFADVAPVDGADGGRPGGNIRVALLVSSRRGARLSRRGEATADTANQVMGDGSQTHLLFSPGRIDPTNAAFSHGRKPLAVEVSFRGSRLVVIATHLRSKSADEPLFGRWQPPTLVSEATRQAEAEVIAGFARALLAADPALPVLVVGDFNDFEYSRPLGTFERVGFVNALASLPVPERYTYVFDGNSQALDHVFLSPGAARRGFDYDVVHVNAEFHDGRSDHDPSVIRVRFE